MSTGRFLAIVTIASVSFGVLLASKCVEDDLLEGASVLPGSSKCYCVQNDLCACCDRFVVPKLKLNDTGCIELIYLPQDLGVSLILEIDNHVLINKTVSVRNPPPVCYDVPHFTFAALCVQLYDLQLQQKTLTGCARALAELEGEPIFERKIGCFKLPTSA